MHKALVLGVVLGALITAAAHAADGLLTIRSNHSVAHTTDRLEDALGRAGFRIFARIDHAPGAQSVNMPLGETQLLIFGNPRGGTVLMQSQRTIGIDLPLKYLVWETERGEVMIGWNDPAWLGRRHAISDRAEALAKMSGALQKFAQGAAQP